MLIDFRVKNFRSIKDEQRLSMVADIKDNKSETHTFAPTKNFTLLKSSAIYGANAAGKSNIIKAISAVRRIVLNSSSKYQSGDKLPLEPFLFDGMTNEPSEFEINFIYKEIRYQYGFSATKEMIVEEWLIAYPKGRAQTWFTREYIKEDKNYNWHFGDKLTGKKELWKESTRNNALYLSTAVQLNSEQLKPIFEWFASRLKITGVRGWNPVFTAVKCINDEKRTQIINFLKMADIDIDDLEIEENKINSSKLSFEVEKEQKEESGENSEDKKVINPIFYRLDNDGSRVPISLNEESDGTKRLFAFIGPWLDSLENGNIIFVDELHDNFHPLMVKFLIDLFHNNTSNKSNAQLIFTTHETSVLNQDTFRRDQIWFCEKQNKATILYPLTDFSPRKDVENIEKGYLSGRYGALPFFKDIALSWNN